MGKCCLVLSFLAASSLVWSLACTPPASPRGNALESVREPRKVPPPLLLLVNFHSAHYRGVFMTEINRPLPFTKPLRFIYLGYTPLSASQRNFGQLRRLC